MNKSGSRGFLGSSNYNNTLYSPANGYSITNLNARVPRLDDTYLRELEQRRQKIDERMRLREQDQHKSLDLFLQHIQKELHMLISDKQQIQERNRQFRAATKRETEQFRKSMAEVVESSEKLENAKRKYMAFLRSLKQ